MTEALEQLSGTPSLTSNDLLGSIKTFQDCSSRVGEEAGASSSCRLGLSRGNAEVCPKSEAKKFLLVQ